MKPFQFRFFDLQQTLNVHKFGTDTMLLGSIASHPNPNQILDIGTGTGALSLMLAQKYATAKLTAVDVNAKAIELATHNFKNTSFKNDFTTYLGSIVESNFTYLYNLIVSNPPYFKASLKSENPERNLARHDDTLSFEDLISVASKYLTDDGLFWVVIPYNRHQQFIEIAKVKKLHLKIFYTVEGSPSNAVRAILCFGRLAQLSVTYKTITIRDEKGNYTEAYQELTKDYHKPGVFSN